MSDAARGTALGALAILSWGTLGALGASSANLAPNLVLGLCFGIAAGIGGVLCLCRGIRLTPLWSTETLVSAMLLTVYHLSYLEAFHHAAAIPVSLINYLWPACLIVIGNLFFRLNSGWPGYLGAATGFVGVALLIGRDGFTLKASDATGYGLAFLGAVFWGTYSNLRRRARFDGIGSMVTICVLSAALCLFVSAVSGEDFTPLTSRDLLVILLLGLGPAGGAFFLWDIGMRRGSATLLSILGYSAPVLSTVLMVALGLGSPSWNMVAAVLLITLGGVIVQGGQRGTP
ncbi:DMT family transporter [Halomonas alimentaria]|uniref:DMT family transporter n=1 Tax=Halomonas alimentaria TaxID=147248 RepID=UPI0024900888|nr:EamA family transporter [Halomonas alimentaria]